MSLVLDEPTTVAAEAEALIKEARQRQMRRRWAIVVVLVVVTAVVVAALSAGSPTQRRPLPTASHPNGPNGGTTTGQGWSPAGSINFYGKWSVTSLAFPSPSDGFAQVSGSTGTNGWALLPRTTDGGRSWQTKIEKTAQTYLAFSSPLYGWSYGAADPRSPWTSVLQTTDGGRTWRTVVTKGNVFSLATSGPVTWMLESFQARPAGKCRYEILRSSGLGRPPLPIRNEPSLGSACDWQLVVLTPSVLYAIETGWQGRSAIISYLSSTDAGATWRTRVSPCHGSSPSATLSGADGSLWLTCSTGPMIDMAGDRFTELYRSLDAGRSWRLESNSISEGSLLVVGRDVAWRWSSENSLGWLEHTSNGGATWSPSFLASPIVTPASDTAIDIHPPIVGEDGLQSESVAARGDSAVVAIEASWFHNSGITLNHLAVCTTTDEGKSWRGSYLHNTRPA